MITKDFVNAKKMSIKNLCSTQVLARMIHRFADEVTTAKATENRKIENVESRSIE